MRRAWITVSVGLAACGAHDAAPAAVNAAGNHGPANAPLPAACQREPAEAGAPPWHHGVALEECIAAARAVDGGYVELQVELIRKVDSAGIQTWQTRLDHAGPDGRTCGFPVGLAVAVDERVVVACGYSLLAFDADGKFAWQVWPGGDNRIGEPVIDDAGTTYVGVGGALVAVDATGATRWKTGTGSNRSLPVVAATPAGALLAVTTMAARHSDDINGMHVYFLDEPPELLQFSRTGVIESRATVTLDAAPAWPAWLDVSGEGGGRLP